jgi:hypothetical protein
VAITALALIGASWAASGWKDVESVAHRLRPAGPRIAALYGELRSGAAPLLATLQTSVATLRHNRLGGLLWIPPALLALALVLRRRGRRNRWPQRQRSVLKLARSGRDVAWIARELQVSQDLVRAVLRPRFERRAVAVAGKGLPDRKLRPAGRSR